MNDNIIYNLMMLTDLLESCGVEVDYEIAEELADSVYKAIDCVKLQVATIPYIEPDYKAICGECYGLICKLDNERSDYKYCPHCGQKIDWDGVEF